MQDLEHASLPLRGAADSGKHAFIVIGGVGRSLGSREGEFEGERVERAVGNRDSGKHALA